MLYLIFEGASFVILHIEPGQKARNATVGSYTGDKTEQETL